MASGDEVTRAGVEDDQRPGSIRDHALGFDQISTGHVHAWLQRDGRRTNHRGDLQKANDLVLEVNIGHPPIKWRRIRRFEPDGEPCAEPAHEWIGEPASTMKLNGEIKMLLRHLREEAFERIAVVDEILWLANSPARWNGNDAVHRPGRSARNVACQGRPSSTNSASG